MMYVLGAAGQGGGRGGRPGPAVAGLLCGPGGEAALPGRRAEGVPAPVTPWALDRQASGDRHGGGRHVLLCPSCFPFSYEWEGGGVSEAN